MVSQARQLQNQMVMLMPVPWFQPLLLSAVWETLRREARHCQTHLQTTEVQTLTTGPRSPMKEKEHLVPGWPHWLTLVHTV